MSPNIDASEVAQALLDKSPKRPPNLIQEIVNKLIKKHGDNLPHWASYKDILAQHNLTPDDVTQDMLNKAISQFHPIRGIQITRLPLGSHFTTLPLGGEIEDAEFLGMAGYDAKVSIGGKIAYWSYQSVVIPKANGKSIKQEEPDKGLVKDFKEALEQKKPAVKPTPKAVELVEKILPKAEEPPKPKKAYNIGKPETGRDRFNAKVGSIPYQINSVLLQAGEEGAELEQIALKSNLPKDRVLQHLKWHQKERGTFEDLGNNRWRITPGK